ncbi:MAG: SusC/RagA family TonB-linked outer membrane protein [Bacteroidia bacterium]
MLSAPILWAQSTVSGVVTAEESGDPIEGVAVLVKGTTVGMFTGPDGRFSLQVPSNGSTLLFSFVGRRTVEEEIGGRSTINVSLEEDALLLDEVLVTAVGLETNRKALGYSVQNIDGDEIIGARETNLVNALNSKVAGVTVVSSSGSPGASANIRVRGSTSINGSNSPLFVVDGVPIDNSTDGNGVAGVDNANRAIDINPNDIASLTVLKGPAATVLYGIRAANGAVIITTKSGRAGKPKVTISAAYTQDQVNKLPDLQESYAQGRPVGGVPTWRGPNTGEGFSWGPRIADLEFDGSDYPYDQNGRLVAKGTGNGVPARAYDPYTFFVPGNTYDLNASVQGGTQDITYYISGGRLYQTGIVPNADFERNSFRTRIDARVTKRLKLGMAANFVNSGGNRIQRGSNISGVMLGLLRNTPTFDIGNGLEGQAAADDPTTYELPDGTQRSYRAGIYDSPYWTVNKNPFVDNVNRIIGYASATYEFTPWLSLSYKLGTDNYSDRRNQAIDINSADTPDGFVEQSTRTSTDLNSDLLLQLNKSFGDLSVNAVLGHNYYSTRVVTQTTQGFTLSKSGFYHISNATDILGFESISQRKLMGVFGSVNLGYKDYLFVELSARNDWASTLPEGANSFFYPAASLGFAFTELLGMRENPIFPYGKLRVSWGQVGNDAPIYATSNYFNASFSGGDGFITGISYPAFGTNSFERDITLGNSQLRPETTTTFEIGGEFKFINGRLGLDVTYYDAQSRDQVIFVQLPASTGFTDFAQNAGLITNRGIELVATGTPFKGDFTWDISLNFTRYRNIVDSLAEGIEEIGLAGFVSTSSRVIAGQPYGAIFGNGYQKDDEGRTIIGNNGWPLLDPVQRMVGDPNPDWIMGLRNTFSYKGVSLSALIDVRQGGDVWCGTCGILDYFGTSQRSADERELTNFVFEGVKADGTPNTTAVALADPAGGINGYYRVRYGFGGTSEESMFDGSWIRLREVTLTYSFPRNFVSKLNLGEASISLTGRNLWLQTDFPGIDPETNLTGASNGFGLEYFNMPNTRSYGAVLRVGF